MIMGNHGLFKIFANSFSSINLNQKVIYIRRMIYYILEFGLEKKLFQLNQKVSKKEFIKKINFSV